MAKSLAILVVHGNHLADDVLDVNLKDLIEEITLIHYHINKLSVVQSGKSVIVFELKNLLKQNDFVLLIDKLQTSLTFRYLQEVFNFPDCTDCLNYPLYTKLLIYDNLIKLHPVVYLSRLFVIQDLNLKLVFDNILKNHLKWFNKKKTFTKNIRVNSYDLLESIDQNDFGVEIKHIEQDSTPVLQLHSYDFDKLIDCQRYILKKLSCQCYPDTYSLEDSYSNNQCFSHVQQATEVSLVFCFI